MLAAAKGRSLLNLNGEDSGYSSLISEDRVAMGSDSEPAFLLGVSNDLDCWGGWAISTSWLSCNLHSLSRVGPFVPSFPNLMFYFCLINKTQWIPLELVHHMFLQIYYLFLELFPSLKVLHLKSQEEPPTFNFLFIHAYRLNYYLTFFHRM